MCREHTTPTTSGSVRAPRGGQEVTREYQLFAIYTTTRMLNVTLFTKKLFRSWTRREIYFKLRSGSNFELASQRWIIYDIYRGCSSAGVKRKHEFLFSGAGCSSFALILMYTKKKKQQLGRRFLFFFLFTERNEFTSWSAEGIRDLLIFASEGITICDW